MIEEMEFQENLRSEDDLGVVIRSHIMIEQLVHKYIDSSMKDPDMFRKIHMDYKDKITLAISLGLDKNLEKTLKCIGTIRNGFAHTLRPEISKQDVNNLYQALSTKEKDTLLRSYDEKLKDDITGSPSFKSLPPRDRYILHASAIYATLLAHNGHYTK
ncbi:TPA: hypothetical protein NJ249_004121 [Vibrio parahaemolyticus]|nr:hypothetical protein [Vibrio parahaemolyticus]